MPRIRGRRGAQPATNRGHFSKAWKIAILPPSSAFIGGISLECRHGDFFMAKFIAL
jgi:hypothetical protein